MKLLTNEQLQDLYVVVDKSGLWKFPNAKKTFEKAMEYENQRYLIVVNGDKATCVDFLNRVSNDIKTPSTLTPYIAYYSNIKEYLDEENKIFYVELGERHMENMI